MATKRFDFVGVEKEYEISDNFTTKVVTRFVEKFPTNWYYTPDEDMKDYLQKLFINYINKYDKLFLPLFNETLSDENKDIVNAFVRIDDHIMELFLNIYIFTSIKTSLLSTDPPKNMNWYKYYNKIVETRENGAEEIFPTEKRITFKGSSETTSSDSIIKDAAEDTATSIANEWEKSIALIIKDEYINTTPSSSEVNIQKIYDALKEISQTVARKAFVIAYNTIKEKTKDEEIYSDSEENALNLYEIAVEEAKKANYEEVYNAVYLSLDLKNEKEFIQEFLKQYKFDENSSFESQSFSPRPPSPSSTPPRRLRPPISSVSSFSPRPPSPPKRKKETEDEENQPASYDKDPSSVRDFDFLYPGYPIIKFIFYEKYVENIKMIVKSIE